MCRPLSLLLALLVLRFAGGGVESFAGLGRATWSRLRLLQEPRTARRVVQEPPTRQSH